MDLAAAVAPRRSLLVPALAVLAPLLWFGYRGATAPPAVTGTFDPTPGAVLVAVVGATAISYLLAAVAVATLHLDAVDPGGRPVVAALVRPSDGAVALVALVAVAVAGYLAATQFLVVPGWLAAVLEPLGAVLALPLAVVYVGVLAVGNALAVESFALEAVAVAVGVSLSVPWVFLLADGAAAALRRVLPAGVTRR